ncbi:MAG: hypothetical protein II865_02380 [Bacteroidales bacterium]|nr:hypothetical protein [Bacteroidales bacterium]
MREVIRNFCEDTQTSNGLLLIDMPTGAGKTYEVIHYIKELMEIFSEKKIFFITTLKKNLDAPYNDLLEILSEEQKKKVFRIKSNIDFVKENFDSIKDDVKENDKVWKSDEFKQLKEKYEIVDFLKKYKKETQFKEFEDAERNFRKMLTYKLHEEFKDRKKKLQAVKTLTQWHWIGELYPSVYTQDYSVYFLTIDKFLLEHSTIVEHPYFFYNHPSFKNSFVFVDEFDATKETMLNNIIDRNIENGMNYIDLFKRIHSGLLTREIPKRLITPSENRKKNEYNKKFPLEKIIDDIKKLAQETNEKHKLDFCHKSQNFDHEERYFLFNDFGYSSMVSDQKDIVTKFDGKGNWNAILLNSDSETKKIQEVLSDVKRFINYFLKGVSVLSINYQQLRQEEISHSDTQRDYSIDSAIQTVLSTFIAEPSIVAKLVREVQMTWKGNNNEANNINDDYESGDTRFCNKGWNYYEFLDEDRHDLKTDIFRYSFEETPEKIMKKMCLSAKVIGLSATASLESVTANYDLNYLKWRLHSGYRQLTENDRERLHQQFKNSVSGYKEDMIQVGVTEHITDDDYINSNLWGIIFSNEEKAELIHDELESMLPPKLDSKGKRTDVYQKRRYLRVAWVYKQFVQQPEIYSLLCMLTTLPKEDSNTLKWSFLQKIFKAITEDVKETYDKDIAVIMDSADFDNKKDDILGALAKGQRRFVVSSYQTIGAGQNLQYDIPKLLKGKLVHTNNFKEREQKDFDSIYLDKPTNVMVNMILPDVQLDEMARYIYQCEYLCDNYEITKVVKDSNIRAAFDKLRGKSKFFSPLLSTKSARIAATRCLIQAVGRICRTNMKNPHIYIFAHDEIADVLYYPIIDDESKDFNWEFRKLVEKLSVNRQSLMSEEIDTAKKAEDISYKANRQILKMLNFKYWNKESIEQWQRLRDYVLQHPTLTQEDWENCPWKFFYIELPTEDNKVYYKTENDFFKTEVSFSAQSEFTAESVENVNLHALLKLPGLKTYFEQMEYATNWEKHKFIMSPPLFNNIYKGALGEFVGRVFFSQILNVELEDLVPEYYEFFDFKVKGKPVFVDFKHWKESTQFNANEYIEKINVKKDECRAETIIVANTQIVNQSNYQPSVTQMIVEIPCLYSLVNDELVPNEQAVLYIKNAIDGKYNKSDNSKG